MRIYRIQQKLRSYTINSCHILCIHTTYRSVLLVAVAGSCRNPTKYVKVLKSQKLFFCNHLLFHRDYFQIFRIPMVFIRFYSDKMGVIRANAMGHVAPFALRTLLYGDDNLDFTENKRIITETLRFINDSKRFA